MKRKTKHIGRKALVKEVIDLLSLPVESKTVGYFSRNQLTVLILKINQLIKAENSVRK